MRSCERKPDLGDALTVSMVRRPFSCLTMSGSSYVIFTGYLRHRNEKNKATKKPKKRGAYPKSAVRIIRRLLFCYDTHSIVGCESFTKNFNDLKFLCLEMLLAIFNNFFNLTGRWRFIKQIKPTKLI